MKIVLLVLICIVCALGFSSLEYEQHFLEWMQTHKKSYHNFEYQHRFEIFKQNMDFINKHNNGSSSFQLKMNQFGDLTNEEFKSIYLHPISIPRSDRQKIFNPRPRALPTSWSWEEKGGVTPVPTQNQCGNCWAFATIGTVETCGFIQTGQLVPLSVQQLMDCSTSYGNQGCNGGLMDQSYQYLIDNNGIDSAACYPSTDQENPTCNYSASCCALVLTGFKDVTPIGNETALQYAVSIASVAVAIDASQTSFQFYSSGVYYEPACSSTNLDHTPLVVGWGVSQGSDFWNVRNSWGTSWGNNGYIWLSRNRNNNCGIATMASFASDCKKC